MKGKMCIITALAMSMMLAGMVLSVDATYSANTDNGTLVTGAGPYDFDGVIPDIKDTPPQGASIVDYNLTDNWGGTWCDAEKTADDPDDDLMCWAAAASNVLEWTGWGFVEHSTDGKITNCDQMFEHFNDHWEDEGANVKIAWIWWFDGTDTSPGGDWSEVDVAGGGDFWTPPHDFDNYFHEYSGSETLQHIDEYLHNGWGVALGIYDGGHAITCWGIRYNDSVNKTTNPEDYYLGIYVTDSDDNKWQNSWDPPEDRLRYYDVFYNSTGGYWEFTNYGGGGWHISDVYALERNPSLDPDLAIYKSAYPDVVMAGEELFYNITVVNENEIVGGTTAYNVTVTDTLPVGVTYIADTGGGVLVSGSTYTWNLGNIAPGDSRSFTIKVRVDPDYVVNHGSSIVNTASVTSITPHWESDLTNNEATVTSFVQDEADLKVTKIVKPDGEARAGETFNYTIFVENLGPSTATVVTLTDSMIADGDFSVSSINAPNYTPAVSSLPDGLEYTFTRSSPMNPGERDIITINVAADETQDINNIVTVNCSNFDPDLSNNQAMTMTAVTDVADLQITKTSITTGPFYAGTDIQFQLEVTNIGPSTAENVVVKDYLPSGVRVISVGPSTGTCTTGRPSDSSAPLTWNIGTMPNGRTDTLTVTVHIGPDYLGYLENDAVVTSDIFDPDNSNNRDYTLINVEAQTDLTLVKYGSPDPVLAGNVLEYFYNVTNNGPSTARDVVLVDDLPDEVEFITAFATVGSASCTYSATQNRVTCDIGDMEPGDTINITVRTQVHSDVANDTTITNQAEVYSSTPDPTPNLDFVNTLVQTQADLEIQKTSEPTKVYEDEQIKYTILVTNNGPSDALNVTVTDYLPKGVRYEIDTDNFTIISKCPDILTADLGTLKPGETREIAIWAKVLHSCRCSVRGRATFINRACVDSETNDPVSDNNCAIAKNLKFDGERDNSVWVWFAQILFVGMISTAAVITYKKKRNHNL